MSFTDTANNLPYNISTDSQEYFEVVAQFWLTSTNCSINLSATVAVTDQVSRKIYFYQKDRENKAMDYSIIVTVICVLHLYACMQLIKQSSQNEAEGHRFSLVTIGFLTSWDIFLCLFHLFEALTITVIFMCNIFIFKDFFHYFITPAFWYFILGTIFETRFLMIIWKTHNHTNFQVVNFHQPN